MIEADATISGVSQLAEARARWAWLAAERGTARAADCTAMALDALQDGTLLEARRTVLPSTAASAC